MVRRTSVAVALLVVVAAAAMFWKARHAVSGADDKSMAVLPFDDISGDTANRAFILGVHGEIVTQMTKLPGVQVASRGSSSRYAGSRMDTRDIAAELGVSKILTGTVQRSAGEIHFQVELQDATTGRPLWAESYNQELTAANLFAIQGEVARKVASALSITLSEAAASDLSRAPTKSLAALDLYHQGELLWTEKGFVARDTLAVRVLEQAVALDPSFAQAWAVLTKSRSWLVRQGVTFDTLPARRALDHAVALAPKAAETRIASGWYRYYAHADFTAALAEFREAERLLPASSEISAGIGVLLRRLGRYDEALVEQIRSAEKDPRNVSARLNLALTYLSFARYGDAVKTCDDALRIDPSSPTSTGEKFFGLLGLGDTAAAGALLRAQGPHLDVSDRGLMEASLAAVRRDQRGTITATRAAQLGLPGPDGSSGGTAQAMYATIAVVSRIAGDRAAARAAADTALAVGDSIVRLARRRVGDPFGNAALADGFAAVALAAAGDSARAVTRIETAARDFNRQRDGADGPTMNRLLAMVYMLVGRPHDAVAQLRISLGTPQMVGRTELRMSLLWDPLRADPEFKALLASFPR